MSFPDILKNLRKRDNINQFELARAIGVSRSAVGMYESGKREPDFETMETIADYFNVSMDYLLGRTDNPEINKSNEKTHIIKIAARNGSYKELALNDEELEELQRKINSLPEATDL